jgi:hypothetical protein
MAAFWISDRLESTRSRHLLRAKADVHAQVARTDFQD